MLDGNGKNDAAAADGPDGAAMIELSMDFR
jgi:hypothetical protein